MGKILRVAIWLAYTPFGKILMVNKSKKASNLDLFSGELIPDKTMFYPFPPCPQADHTTNKQNTLQKLVDQLTCIISLWTEHRFE